MFQTRRTGEQSYNVKPFNTDYSAKTIAGPVEVYDHLVSKGPLQAFDTLDWIEGSEW